MNYVRNQFRELRHENGYTTASYDWQFSKDAMNFLGNPGFLPPVREGSKCSIAKAGSSRPLPVEPRWAVLGRARLQLMGSAGERYELPELHQRQRQCVLGVGPWFEHYGEQVSWRVIPESNHVV